MEISKNKKFKTMKPLNEYRYWLIYAAMMLLIIAAVILLGKQ
jgi:hypothetical protein